MAPNRDGKPVLPVTGADLLQFFSEYSKAYIANGGPTSRLEDSLQKLGEKLGFTAEILATATGIFTTVITKNGETKTAVCRIKDGGVNLEKLCWLEGIMADLENDKIQLHQGDRILHSRHFRKELYSFWNMLLAAFLAGFSISYPVYGDPIAAIACGFIAATVWWISVPALIRLIPSSIFRDFAGAILTFILASVFFTFHRAPFDSYSIGGIVMLVPGLALTTAISELADQNLISGTSKLMQAILTLLALVLAYLLFLDVAQWIDFNSTLAGFKSAKPDKLISILYFILSLMCFGIIFKVPKKSLPFATIAGILGWGVLGFFDPEKYTALAPFTASFSVGILSLILARTFKVPSQVYSVPGIIALLPGMLALTSFKSFATGNEASGLELGFRVALTAASITFGLFTARIPFASIKKLNS